MKTTIQQALASTALLGLAVSGYAQSLSLSAAADVDLRPAVLQTAPTMALVNQRRETVAFSWLADAAANTTAAPAPHRATSRSYQLVVSGQRLANGVTLATTAPGALIRLSSSDRQSALDLDRLTVTLPTGRSLSAAAASDQLVSGDDLRAAGLSADPRSAGLRLANELGAGSFVLTGAAGVAADADILIDVFDRNSALVLTVQSAADQFFNGTRPAARIELESGDRALDWRSATGVVTSPDGQRFDAVIERVGEQTLARVKTPMTATSGLWEWQIDVTSSQGVMRSVRTAFALTHPVARFDNSVTIEQDKASLRIALGAELKSAGRYEARATLLATDPSGAQRPAMIGAVAGWLEAGSDVLTLEFDLAELKALGLGAPFALNDLRLTDQSRMGVLETRRVGVTF